MQVDSLTANGPTLQYSEPLKFRTTFSGPTFFDKTTGIKHLLLTFYLFDDIKGNIGITHANHSARPKAVLTKLRM